MYYDNLCDLCKSRGIGLFQISIRQVAEQKDAKIFEHFMSTVCFQIISNLLLSVIIVVVDVVITFAVFAV